MNKYYENYLFIIAMHALLSNDGFGQCDLTRLDMKDQDYHVFG